jgi:protein TonB
MVMFVVETDGTLSNVRVAKKVFPSLDSEAVRVVKTMPKWKPGKEKGRPVRVNFTLPVVFSLKK